MTNQIAIFCLIVVLCALGWDWIFNDWQASLLVARKWYYMIEWLAFWR